MAKSMLKVFAHIILGGFLALSAAQAQDSDKPGEPARDSPAMLSLIEERTSER